MHLEINYDADPIPYICKSCRTNQDLIRMCITLLQQENEYLPQCSKCVKKIVYYYQSYFRDDNNIIDTVAIISAIMCRCELDLSNDY